MRKRVIEIIMNEFEAQRESLRLRPLHEQTVIGDLLTSLEIEIKRQIKNEFPKDVPEVGELTASNNC